MRTYSEELEVFRDNSITPKRAWINTIVVLAIFVVALIVALIIRF